MMAHCSSSKMPALLSLVLLHTILLTHHSRARPTPGAVKITQVPSNPRVVLRANESILLQVYVEGEVGDIRSTVVFEGGQQNSCNETRNFESKILETNLSIVCEQAHWANNDLHIQKYEVRITNGEAARLVDQVNVTLKVLRFEEGGGLQVCMSEFEVRLLKNVATTVTEATSTSLPMKVKTTPTDISMTTQVADKLDVTTSAESRQNTTITPVTSQTTPTRTIQEQLTDFLTNSKQNQITVALGFVAILVIAIEGVAIVCLLRYRKKSATKQPQIQNAEVDLEGMDHKDEE